MHTDVAISGQAPGLRESIVSNLLTKDRWKMMLEGLGVTLEISLLSLLLLLVMFYLVFASSGLGKFHIAVLCFSLYFGAYISEIFRSGIEGVGKGKPEPRSGSCRACVHPCAKPKREKSLWKCNQSTVLSMVKRTILRDVFFWNSTSRSLTRLMIL